MKKVLLFLNPSSRQGAENYDVVTKILQEKAWTILNSKEEVEQNSWTRILEKYSHQTDLVLVGGGDGSVNEALEGLVKSQKPLAILPLGTANNLARTLNIPKDIAQAVAIIDQNNLLRIDLGVANDLYFVNVAGVGLSTQVNRQVSPQLKKWLGVLAFIITAIKLGKYVKPMSATIICDGKTYISKSWQITVCNGRNYGSGLTVAADATLTDEKLHCLTTEVKKWWHGFFLMPAMLIGKYKLKQDVSLYEGKTLRIETKKTRKVDLDGDIKTQTPVDFKIIPKAISVYAPTTPS